MNEPPLEPSAPTLLVRPSPRYVAVLVLVASVVLIVGAFLRPKSRQPAIQANELATLPELSQRRMLRDLASYLTDRASAVAASVVYLPGLDASGLVLGRDSILSARSPEPYAALGNQPALPLVLVGSTGTIDSASPAAAVLNLDTPTGRWVMVVGKNVEHRPVSVIGLTGGLLSVQCGGMALREIVFDAVVPLELRGAGVFDLDGNALGLAVPCESRIALIPLPLALRALAEQQTPEYQLWYQYGLRVTSKDSTARRILGMGSGLLVTEVLVGGAADRAGIWPGDGIRMAGSRPVGQPADLATTLASTDATRLGVIRGGQTRTLLLRRFQPAATRARPGVSPTVFALGPADLTPTSRAARAGLQSGDRVLQLNRLRSPPPGSVSRALAGHDSLFLVYERGGHRRSLVLP